MKTDDELDRERTTKIVNALMLPLLANFKQGPQSRERTLEALNALAIAAAFIIQGTGDEEHAHMFFEKALVANLDLNRGSVHPAMRN